MESLQGVVSWQEVAAQIWNLTRSSRNLLHGPNALCPARIVPYGPNDPLARHVHPECAASGCLDHLHEVLLATITRLNGTDLSQVCDLPRYITRVAGHEMIELKRRRRVAAGFPAKPSRTDGVPAKVIAAISAHLDGVERDWALALFRILRSYPFVEGRTSSAWPLDGLTMEKSRLDGGVRVVGSGEARAEIRRDIDMVLDTAVASAGRAWVFDSILSPLQSFRDADQLPDHLVA